MRIEYQYGENCYTFPNKMDAIIFQIRSILAWLAKAFHMRTDFAIKVSGPCAGENMSARGSSARKVSSKSRWIGQYGINRNARSSWR
jgi:hypothetical protein